MNLWVKKIGPILGLALFLFTCEEPGEIGLELGQDVGDFVGSFIEIPLNVGVVKSEPYLLSNVDSVRVIQYNDKTKKNDTTYIHYLNRVNNLIVGSIESEEFGKGTVKAFAQILPLSFPAKIDENATYKDIKFIFNISGYNGDTLDVLNDQYFDIYELTEPLDSTNFSNTEYSYSDTSIGTATINIETDTTNTSVTTILSDDFGLKLFNELIDSTNEATKSDTSFVKFLSGLAFVPRDETTITFNINPIASTRIDLDYELNGETKTKTFVMDGVFTHHVDTDYTGTAFESLSENTPEYNTDKLYLNSTNGILTELDFAPFFELQDSIGALAINKATIIIEGIENKYFYRLPPSLNLFYEESSLFNITEIPFSGGTNQKIDASRIASCTPSLDTLTNTIAYSNSTAFSSILTDILANNDKTFKLLIAPYNYGKVPTQLFTDKENVKMRIYFSHLKNDL